MNDFLVTDTKSLTKNRVPQLTVFKECQKSTRHLRKFRLAGHCMVANILGPKELGWTRVEGGEGGGRPAGGVFVGHLPCVWHCTPEPVGEAKGILTPQLQGC